MWFYKGKSKYYASCPNCHYKVNIRKNANVVEILWDILPGRKRR